jgi:hypothetical protein
MTCLHGRKSSAFKAQITKLSNTFLSLWPHCRTLFRNTGTFNKLNGCIVIITVLTLITLFLRTKERRTDNFSEYSFVKRTTFVFTGIRFILLLLLLLIIIINFRVETVNYIYTYSYVYVLYIIVHACYHRFQDLFVWKKQTRRLVFKQIKKQSAFGFITIIQDKTNI